MVPNPIDVHKADYSPHASWMLALRELAPRHYEHLLTDWRANHHRRRNLWRDVRKVGLGWWVRWVGQAHPVVVELLKAAMA